MEGEFQDETIVCVDCGKEFVFTTGEQNFYKEKGLQNKPKRCIDCRRKKKEQALAKQNNAQANTTEEPKKREF